MTLGNGVFHHLLDRLCSLLSSSLGTALGRQRGEVGARLRNDRGIGMDGLRLVQIGLSFFEVPGGCRLVRQLDVGLDDGFEARIYFGVGRVQLQRIFTRWAGEPQAANVCVS